jgi:hypothetical protein
VKFGIKISAMLSSLVLGLVCFAGCNSDDTAPAPGAKADAGKPATPTPKPDDVKK